MKIKIISKKGEKLRFLLEGTTPAFANSLRRIMIAEVPTLAIDVIDFNDNSSALFDEVIAHRLGMIPLDFDLSKFNFTEFCKCGGKGCPACQVFFALEKTGPAMVYAGDLKSTNRDVKPVSPDFPIVKLLENQHVKLGAIAKLGKGKEHAKWQAANVSYQYLPTIEIKHAKDLKKIEKACPKGVLGIRNGKLVLIDPFNCDECKLCEEVSDKAIELKGDPEKILFTVESISGLDPADIVKESVKILQEKAQEFRDQLNVLLE